MEIPTDHPTDADRPNPPVPGDPLNVPRAPEHRAAPSAVKPLKSGINTKALFIPGEDPAELDAINERYRHDWQPVSGLECFLVDSLVRDHWLLQRLSRVEAELWIHQIKDARTSAYHKLDEEAPVGDTYSRNYERFTRLQRRIDSTERSYYRALHELRRLHPDPGSGKGPGRPPAEDSGPLIPKQPAANAPTLTGKLASFSTPPAIAKLASFGLDPAARTRPLPPAAEAPSRIVAPPLGFPIAASGIEAQNGSWLWSKRGRIG